VPDQDTFNIKGIVYQKFMMQCGNRCGASATLKIMYASRFGPPTESPTIGPHLVDSSSLVRAHRVILVPSCDCVALGAPPAIRRARDSCETGNPRQRGEPTRQRAVPKGDVTVRPGLRNAISKAEANGERPLCLLASSIPLVRSRRVIPGNQGGREAREAAELDRRIVVSNR
jgi:hypothetical protein